MENFQYRHSTAGGAIGEGLARRALCGTIELSGGEPTLLQGVPMWQKKLDAAQGLVCV